MTLPSPLPPALRDLGGPLLRGLLQVTTFSFFINILVMTLPLYMMQVFDRVIPTRHLETLFFLTLITVVAIAVHGVLEAVRTHLLTRIAAWVADRLKGEVLAACVRRPETGKRPFDEVEALQAGLTSPAVIALFDLPWIPVFVTIIWLVHPVLGAAALACIASLAAAILASHWLIRRRVGEGRGQESEADRFAAALIQNAASVIAMAMWPAVYGRWRHARDRAAASRMAVDDLSARFGAAAKSLRLLIQAVILGLGAYLTVLGEISMGTIIAVSIMLGRALAPVDVLTGTWKQLVRAHDAAQTLGRFLQAGVVRETIALPVPLGAVEAQGVTVTGSPAHNRAILHQVSFSIAPGETIAVIGPSGAGKSTLCRALLGCVPLRSGRVRIDGADIADWRPADLAPHVGYLPQRSEFLPGTVRDNIARFGDVPDDMVIAAAKLARIHHVILGLPLGYATELGPDGTPLSGGQQQQIGLARALFGRPRLVVLDEPNANLDGEGAHALAEALDVIRQSGATIVMAVHSARMLRGVDKVLALRDGQVEVFGPTREVLDRFSPANRVA